MDVFGIERHLDLSGPTTSVAEIFVDDAGGRAIYMAPGATSETHAEHVRRDHAELVRGAARLSTEVSQLPLDAVCEALALAREAGIPSVVDLDVPPSDAVATLGDPAALEAALRAAAPARSWGRRARPAGPSPPRTSRAAWSACPRRSSTPPAPATPSLVAFWWGSTPSSAGRPRAGSPTPAAPPASRSSVPSPMTLRRRGLACSSSTRGRDSIWLPCPAR